MDIYLICVFIYLFILRQGLTLVQWCSLGPSLQPPPPGFKAILVPQGESHASPSQGARTTGASHHTEEIFVFLVEMGFCHIGQAGLELLTSDDLPASASQIAVITGVSNRAWPSSMKSFGEK